jgi:hypothetical protein
MSYIFFLLKFVCFIVSLFRRHLASSFVPLSKSVSIVSSKAYSNWNVVRGSTSRSKKNDIVMMPIGVPKVAYRVPGSQSADWYVYIVCQTINFAFASQVLP